MASQTFSMEKILDWRSDLEETAKRKVAQIQVKLDAQQAVLEDLIRENIKVKNDRLKINKINAMAASGNYTTSQIAQATGLSSSTIVNYMKGGLY